MRRHIIILLCVLAALQVFENSSAYGAGYGSLDIAIPSSYPVMADTVKAFDMDMRPVEAVNGNIEVIRYGSNKIYLCLPARAGNNTVLSSFYDTSSGALFRNNTMIIPVRGPSGQLTSMLIMATEDMVSQGGTFYSRVTGIELDTPVLNGTYGGRNVSVNAIIYLKGIPDNTIYHMSIVEDNNIKKAVSAAARDSNMSIGDIGLMVNVSSTSMEGMGSISYIVLNMEVDSLWVKRYGERNLSAYRYSGDNITMIPGMVLAGNVSGSRLSMSSDSPGLFILASTRPSGDTPVLSALLGITYKALPAMVILMLMAVLALIIKNTRRKG